MTPKEKKAFDAMLGALKQCTSRADERLKKYFKSRTKECSEDYSKCVKAIALAEAVLAPQLDDKP